MRNIINEKPTADLNGRLLASVSFLDNQDINEKKILDIGCGYGWCELYLLRRNARKIVGTEITENDLETARENIQNEKIEFKVASALSLPFEDEYFDTIICWEVIEHIPLHTEEIMFSEVKRVLKKGGTFYLSTPFEHFLSKVLDPAWLLIAHRHYTLKKLEDFGLKNSLYILKYQVRGGMWSLVTVLNMYISKWIFRRSIFFKDYFTKKDNEEYSLPTGIATIFVKFKDSRKDDE